MAKSRESDEESREEEEESLISGSESDSEESKLPDNSQPTRKPSCTPALVAKKSHTRKPTGPDTSPAEDPNIKASNLTATKKQRSKPMTNQQVPSTKRLKKQPEKYESEKKVTTHDESRKFFERVWTEDDEIVILEGMIAFSAKKNAVPYKNIDSFHDCIKKSVTVDVNMEQLKGKMRRLQKKYSKNVDKEKKGNILIFPNEHEKKAFELSKKVWGHVNSTAGGKLESPNFNGEEFVNAKMPVNEVNEEQVKNLGGGINGFEVIKFVNLGLGKFGIEEWFMENIGFVDAGKKAKMDEKWNNFKSVEAEFYRKKLVLMLEETNLVLDALKSSS